MTRTTNAIWRSVVVAGAMLGCSRPAPAPTPTTTPAKTELAPPTKVDEPTKVEAPPTVEPTKPDESKVEEPPKVVSEIDAIGKDIDGISSQHVAIEKLPRAEQKAKYEGLLVSARAIEKHVAEAKARAKTDGDREWLEIHAKGIANSIWWIEEAIRNIGKKRPRNGDRPADFGFVLA